MVKGHPWPLLLSFLSKFKRPNHTVSIGIKEISPPLQHQAALIKVHAARTLLLSLWFI